LTLRIVTLNTWKNDGDYQRRFNLMSTGLEVLEADVICLQECFVGGGFNTAERLATALGMYAYEAPSRRKLRDNGAGRVMSTSGLAILTREKAARVDVHALVSDPRDGQRIAQLVDLSVSGPPLRVLNLHLTHLRGARADTLRATQLSMALDWAATDHERGLVLAGDLNATAADGALASLALDPTPATLHGPRLGTAPERDMAIDHCVLVRPGGWRAVATTQALDRHDDDGWYPSDHAAVVLDLISQD
jgi:endonuclease/exonuclease/phosphatase family metal-dependent hydrolase